MLPYTLSILFRGILGGLYRDLPRIRANRRMNRALRGWLKQEVA